MISPFESGDDIIEGERKDPTGLTNSTQSHSVVVHCAALLGGESMSSFRLNVVDLRIAQNRQQLSGWLLPSGVYLIVALNPRKAAHRLPLLARAHLSIHGAGLRSHASLQMRRMFLMLEYSCIS